MSADDPQARPEPRVPAFRAFRHRDFRLLWTGMLLVHALMPLQFVTQILYLQAVADDSSRLLLAGLLGAVRGGAMVFFGVVGGAFADRMDRRRLLITMQSAALTANALVAAVMILQPGPDALTYALFFAFTLLAAGAAAVDSPTRQAMVPQLVGARDLPNAIALDAVAIQIAFPLSLPLTGFLIALVGHGPTYALSLAGHASILAALLAMRYRGGAAVRQRAPLVRNIREGFAYAWTHPTVLWIVLLLFSVMGLGFPAVANLGPVWMTRVMNLSPQGFGLMAATWGVGAMLASLTMANVGHFPRKGYLLCGAALGFSVCVTVFGYSRSIPVTALVNVGLGALLTVTQVSAISLTQRMVPNEVQGRVMSLFMLNQGLAQLNTGPIGALAQAFTLQLVVPVLGWVSMAAAALIVLGRPAVRRAGLMPEAAPAGAAEPSQPLAAEGGT